MAQGESLSGAVRWERDVVRLERATLEQKHSRYEVQGDYSIPAGVPLPSTAAALALPPLPEGTVSLGTSSSEPSAAIFDPAAGRWRLQARNQAKKLDQ